MNIAPIARIKNISRTNNFSSIEENKTILLGKGSKSNEDNLNISERKTPEENRCLASYNEINEVMIEDNFLQNIEHRTKIVIKNKKYTTPVTFGFSVSHSSNKINVFDRHKNIFEAMTLVDNTTVMITPSGKIQTPKGISIRTRLCIDIPFGKSTPKST